MKTCAHCGRRGDGSVVGGWISDSRTPPQGAWLCHPDDAHRNPRIKPFDCYRLVTVYNEPVGARKPEGKLHRG